MPRKRNGYPIKIEKWYNRKLNQYVRQWQKQAVLHASMLKPYFNGGTKVLQDADNSNDPNWVRYVQQVLSLMSTSIENTQTDQQIDGLVRRYIYAVDAFSDKRVKYRRGVVQMQSGIVGLNPLQNNTKLQEYTTAKITENTNLIKTMRGRYTDQLKSDIYRTITKGGGISDLSHSIANRTGMALRHATLIANDQTGSILSQVDAYRNKQAGATKYIWRSMEDGRVRPKHQELDGQVFAYDDPNGGDDGQLPGEPIRCRCYADAID